MLKTGFIGSENLYDQYICWWLRQQTDLRLIVWTDSLRWAAPPRRWRKIGARYRVRARALGWRRVVDEIIYFAIYSVFLRGRDSRRLGSLIRELAGSPMPAFELHEVREIRPSQIDAPSVLDALRDEQLDAIFAMCVDVLIPESIVDAPRLGSYLWHEGITPEYRGRYPAFWALANQDYGNLGYTLLRMNMKFDAGDVFVQGRVKDVDPLVDSHVFIGHKAVLDSLPETEQFLDVLNRGAAAPLIRTGAVNGCYTYPTASAFARIAWHRARGRTARFVRRRPLAKDRNDMGDISPSSSHRYGGPPYHSEKEE
jgi:hypothetical protein